jgi:PIN domain nuclease of toxin-antitoxin system
LRLLLDTHALIWWLGQDPQLSERAAAAISLAGNSVHVSIVSAWEIAIKQSRGKLNMPGDLGHAIEVQRFDLLPITLVHIAHLRTLPAHHRDPFDRMLLAQAAAEDLTFVSGDRKMAAYGLAMLW